MVEEHPSQEPTISTRSNDRQQTYDALLEIEDEFGLLRPNDIVGSIWERMRYRVYNDLLSHQRKMQLDERMGRRLTAIESLRDAGRTLHNYLGALSLKRNMFLPRYMTADYVLFWASKTKASRRWSVPRHILRSFH